MSSSGPVIIQKIFQDLAGQWLTLWKTEISCVTAHQLMKSVEALENVFHGVSFIEENMLRAAGNDNPECGKLFSKWLIEMWRYSNQIQSPKPLKLDSHRQSHRSTTLVLFDITWIIWVLTSIPSPEHQSNAGFSAVPSPLSIVTMSLIDIKKVDVKEKPYRSLIDFVDCNQLLQLDPLFSHPQHPDFNEVDGDGNKNEVKSLSTSLNVSQGKAPWNILLRRPIHFSTKLGILFRELLNNACFHPMCAEMLAKAPIDLFANMFKEVLVWERTGDSTKEKATFLSRILPTLLVPPRLSVAGQFILKEVEVSELMKNNRKLLIVSKYFALPITETHCRYVFEQIIEPKFQVTQIIDLMLAISNFKEKEHVQSKSRSINMESTTGYMWLIHFLIPVFDLLSESGMKEAHTSENQIRSHDLARNLFLHVLISPELSLLVCKELCDETVLYNSLVSAVQSNQVFLAGDPRFPELDKPQNFRKRRRSPSSSSPQRGNWSFAEAKPTTFCELISLWSDRWASNSFIPINVLKEFLKIQFVGSTILETLQLSVMEFQIKTRILAMCASINEVNIRSAEIEGLFKLLFSSRFPVPRLFSTALKLFVPRIALLDALNSSSPQLLEILSQTFIPEELFLPNESEAIDCKQLDFKVFSIDKGDTMGEYLLFFTKISELLLCQNEVLLKMIYSIYHHAELGGTGLPMLSFFLGCFQSTLSQESLLVPLDVTPETIGYLLPFSAHSESKFAALITDILVTLSKVSQKKSTKEDSSRRFSAYSRTLISCFFIEFDRLIKLKLHLEQELTVTDIQVQRGKVNEYPPYLTTSPPIEDMDKFRRVNLQLDNFTKSFCRISAELDIDVTSDASILDAVFNRLVIQGKTRTMTIPVTLSETSDEVSNVKSRSIPCPLQEYSFPNPYLLQLLAEIGAGPAFCHAFELPLARDFTLPVAPPTHQLTAAEHLPIPVPDEMLDRGFSALYAMMPKDVIPFSLLLPVLESVFYISEALQQEYQTFLSSPWPPLQVSIEQYMLVVQRILMPIEARSRVDIWWCTVEFLIRRKVPAPLRS
jgi:hypothetical protein